ncbi:ATP phosphoribosyltransferase regulatory subunit [Haematobacter massiliensis]|uniref:ATP phosphoribosyltransferase regulatory subunit n=1 Tax=Haematobacter massiliensis TaxID=195105 RepID=UPI000B498D9D|nr:ATP phosphoribosyltransferase regulatory subunit [Haematobacter massiliensis]OWJ71475.1 ATP phosphoribosyltransferase regulatory subunit [Haematobacter massiliensis]
MPRKAAARGEGEAIFSRFLLAGALPVETDILQPAETLLDLYGEDIRARAYVTSDPLRGEQMLRPDFTVPVVQMHMAQGAEPARYTYFGEVFRRQEHRGARASEYFQVGYELFARDDIPAADAEVFALFAEILAPLGLRAATGDMGLLLAAVNALETSEARKARLHHHIWRPRRFRALLDQYSGRTKPTDARKRMLQGLAATPVERLLWEAGTAVGLRSDEEVAARVRHLVEEADTPPIPAVQAEILDELIGLRDTAPAALSRLEDLSVDMPGLFPAVERMSLRLDALVAHGIDVDRLDFEASFGRTTLEYYDGFVFGFYAEGRPDLPPVATGGRYDAMTSRLGLGQSIPAVGGIIRPGVLAELKEAGEWR